MKFSGVEIAMRCKSYDFRKINFKSICFCINRGFPAKSAILQTIALNCFKFYVISVFEIFLTANKPDV